jgi:sensor histidine kinase YesM
LGRRRLTLAAMQSAKPLPEGQRVKPASLFARYRAWERRLYARQIADPQDLAGIDAYSNYFYSWNGWWIHAAEVLLAIGFAFVLQRLLGVTLWVGVPVGYAVVSVLAAYIILAWYTPRFYVKTFKVNLIKIVPLMLAGLVCGIIAGAMVRSWQTKQRIPTASEYGDVFTKALQEPIVWLMIGGALLWGALLAGIARARKHQLEQENALLLAASERDQAARAAAEAQLKVLQVQIKPHFLFNTLAAMQHWVDSKDDRASPILRELTQFLRASVSALDKPVVTIGEELDLVRPYLAIMAARMGNRLQVQVAAAPQTLSQTIPPGIILTLTENALEHGITPALHGGLVSVSVQQEGRQTRVEVADTGVGFAGEPHYNVGLRNTQERLKSLFGDAAQLTLVRDSADEKTLATIVLNNPES